jgi:hypothetical protein
VNPCAGSGLGRLEVLPSTRQSPTPPQVGRKEVMNSDKSRPRIEPATVGL